MSAKTEYLYYNTEYNDLLIRDEKMPNSVNEIRLNDEPMALQFLTAFQLYASVMFDLAYLENTIGYKCTEKQVSKAFMKRAFERYLKNQKIVRDC